MEGVKFWFWYKVDNTYLTSAVQELLISYQLPLAHSELKDPLRSTPCLALNATSQPELRLMGHRCLWMVVMGIESITDLREAKNLHLLIFSSTFTVPYHQLSRVFALRCYGAEDSLGFLALNGGSSKNQNINSQSPQPWDKTRKLANHITF